MRFLARCAPLGWALLISGCGAPNGGVSGVAAASVASPLPPPPAAEPGPACVSRDVRAALDACAEIPRSETSKRAPALGRPAPVDAKRLTGSDPCSRQGRIAEAVAARRPGSKDDVMAELERLLEVYRGLAAAEDPALRLACESRTARMLIETALAWHEEAVGRGGARGTADAKTMELATRLYERVLQTFDREAYAKLELPGVGGAGWPSLFEIKYAMADLLYFEKDWRRCGPAFDAAFTEDPDSPKAAEAVYASALCYQNVYSEMHRPEEEKADATKQPRELTEVEQHMTTSFGRYLCYVKPKAGDRAGDQSYAEVEFARARTYFGARRWEEAAVSFRDVAMRHADTEVGVYAAQLYLEALNRLGSASRPACYDDMARDVPRFIELYCKGDSARSAEACDILGRIQRDIDRLHAGDSANPRRP